MTTPVFADLHLHSQFSDGTYTPGELAILGKLNGFATLSLCDHDTTEGCPLMFEACANHGIEFITGCELTAELDKNELHLLAYGIDTHHPVLLQELNKFQHVRQNRIREIVACLNKLGIPLKAESVFGLAKCHAPGRPHVARAMVLAGYCDNLDEAFERFLKRGKPAWVPKYKILAPAAIELIHQAGGVAILAHPGLNRTDEFVPQLSQVGLDGIECFHTKHSTMMSERYLMMADKYSLLITGGSDCHGMSKGKPLIGSIKLPYDHVQQLKAAIAARHKKNLPAEPAGQVISQAS